MKYNKSKINLLLKLLSLVLVIVMIVGSIPVIAASKQVKVTTKKALTAELKKSGTKTIVFSPKTTKTVTIPSIKNSRKKTLIVNSSKAKIVNNSVFKSIEIKKCPSFIEKATGNKIAITGTDIKFTVYKGKSLKSLTLSGKTAEVTAQKKSVIENMVCNKKSANYILQVADKANVNVNFAKKSSLLVTGSKKSDVNIKANVSGSTVIAEAPVNVDAKANLNLNLKKGSEGSEVNYTSGVNVKLNNESAKAPIEKVDGKIVSSNNEKIDSKPQTTEDTGNTGNEGSIGSTGNTSNSSSEGNTGSTQNTDNSNNTPIPVSVPENNSSVNDNNIENNGGNTSNIPSSNVNIPTATNDVITPTSAEPIPTQISAIPTPTQVSAIPTPTQVSAIPTPTQISAEPTPTQVSAIPTPTQVSAIPTPTQISAEPTPTRISVELTPTQVSAMPTPTQVSAMPTPAQISVEPTPTQISAEPTPTQISSEPTPTQISAEPTPTLISDEPTPTPTEAIGRPYTTKIQVEFNQIEARTMLDKINALRAEQNDEDVEPLVIDYDLEKVAMQRAAEIAVTFGTTRPDGASAEQTLVEYGFNPTGRYNIFAEMICMGDNNTTDLEAAFDYFASTSKYRVSLLGYYYSVGIGHVRIDETDFWVIDLYNKSKNLEVTSPVNGKVYFPLNIPDSLLASVSAEYESGVTSVSVGVTAATPVYLPKAKFVGSEMDVIYLAPIDFWSEDEYVKALGTIIKGKKAGTGTISGTVLGKTLSVNIEVTE